MMYVDVDFATNQDYFHQCTNHEIWHLYDFAMTGSFCPTDFEWESLNPLAFRYKGGGWIGYHTEFVNDFYPQPGFITSYATLGIDEDKAEIFMYYFTSHLRYKLEKLLTYDEILRAKVQIILNHCELH